MHIERKFQTCDVSDWLCEFGKLILRRYGKTGRQMSIHAGECGKFIQLACSYLHANLRKPQTAAGIKHLCAARGLLADAIEHASSYELNGYVA